MKRADGSMPWLEEGFDKNKPKCPEEYKEIEEYVRLGSNPTLSIKEFLIKFRLMFEYSKHKDYDKAYEVRNYLFNEGFKTDYKNLPDFNKDLIELEKKYGTNKFNLKTSKLF